METPLCYSAEQSKLTMKHGIIVSVHQLSPVSTFILWCFNCNCLIARYAVPSKLLRDLKNLLTLPFIFELKIKQIHRISASYQSSHRSQGRFWPLFTSHREKKKTMRKIRVGLSNNEIIFFYGFGCSQSLMWTDPTNLWISWPNFVADWGTNRRLRTERFHIDWIA